MNNESRMAKIKKSDWSLNQNWFKNEGYTAMGKAIKSLKPLTN